jgi:hypothetical protein
MIKMFKRIDPYQFAFLNEGTGKRVVSLRSPDLIRDDRERRKKGELVS